MRIPSLSLLILGATLSLHAAETPLRIAIIDSKALFDGFKGTKEAQDKYDKQVAAWEQEVADRQKELGTLKDKFEKQSLMLSDEKKKELQTQFMTKQADLQKLVQNLYGKDGRVVKKNEEFTGPIIQRIRVVAQQVAKAEGYDLVLDKASGAVFYASREELDLTGKVLDRLNADYVGANPVAAPKTAPAAPATSPAGAPAKP
jgi:outer membrane protein